MISACMPETIEMPGICKGEFVLLRIFARVSLSFSDCLYKFCGRRWYELVDSAVAHEVARERPCIMFQTGLWGEMLTEVG